MALLPDAGRQQIKAQWMREPIGACAVTKVNLQAAIDAIDTWVDGNAAAFNLAIPQPARAALTAKQKAWLLTFVVQQRLGVL